MAIKLLKAGEAWPFFNGNRIHKQDDHFYFAIGQEELAKLPKPQQEAVQEALKRNESYKAVGAMLFENGTLYLNEGTPFIARISPKGEFESYMPWFH